MAPKYSEIKRREIRKILIANRGEIAVRIIRAARDLGKQSVAVYSEPDSGGIHVRLADEKIPLGGSSAKDTYLNMDKIVLAAIQSGADAIHPGYGFLSENSEFAKKVEDAGLVFIGPSSSLIALMGDKLSARRAAEQAGVPLLDGYTYSGNLAEAKKFSSKIGYPVIVKASAGGSGRGIRVCDKEEDLAEALEDASREGEAAFGSGVVYVEKFLRNPKHIEVQIVGDLHGDVAHFFERECSLQRRRQKLLEEAPAITVSQKVRDTLLEAAVSLAKKTGYHSAGTIEFLVDTENAGKFYFLEMNTRIQVEHPVTEQITGSDLVVLQIQIAEGQKALLKQIKKPLGHSIEFRIYSEDTKNKFAPVQGRIQEALLPLGPGVRLDSWIEKGSVVSPYYDAMLAKIIISGEDRTQVIARARRAFYETRIEGLTTNISFFRWLLEQEAFISGKYDIRWLEANYAGEGKESFYTGANLG